VKVFQLPPPPGRLSFACGSQGRVAVPLDSFCTVPDGFGMPDQSEASVSMWRGHPLPRIEGFGFPVSEMVRILIDFFSFDVGRSMFIFQNKFQARVWGSVLIFSEPQNIEQGISNVEGRTSSFCGFLFDIRYSSYPFHLCHLHLASFLAVNNGQLSTDITQVPAFNRFPKNPFQFLIVLV
jgi:hypothetical protein